MNLNIRQLLNCLVFALLCSCNQQYRQKYPYCEEFHVLQVALDETKTSLFDIFEKIELIPLETNPESLIKKIYKIKYHNNNLYIFDLQQNALLFFDYSGKFLDKIHKIGKGPGEYQLIYDFFIDTIQSQIGMLSPYSAVYHYNFQGDFIKKTDLPNPPQIYRYMELLSGNRCAFWSRTNGTIKPLNIVSMATGENVGSFFYEENSLIEGYCDAFFRDEKGNLYFISGFCNDVFIVRPDGYKISYTWDFGKRNNNIENYKFPIYKTGERSQVAKKFHQSFMNGESSLFYYFIIQNQTNLFYYAYLMFPFNKNKHIFYHKQTGKYHFFEHTAEGHSINEPLLMTNEFMLAELDFEKKELIAPYLLSDKDREILSNFQEEDNPCLVKYSFKK